MLRKLSYRGEWPRALNVLRANPSWVGAAGPSKYTIFHQIAFNGAPSSVIEEVLSICDAAQCSDILRIRTSDGTPAEIARSNGHTSTANALELALTSLESAVAGTAAATTAAATSDATMDCAPAAASTATGAGITGHGTATASLDEKIRASLLLCGVGDAIGYHDGAFEFSTDAAGIQAAIDHEGGGAAIVPDPSKGWMVSDDTVQHLATLQALVDNVGRLPNKSPASAGATAEDVERFSAVMTSMARHHVASWSDMDGRAPGGTCRRGVTYLSADGATWDTAVPFRNTRNAGCGSAMRAMGLGAVLFSEADEQLLVALAAESGALSHHSVAGCAAAVVSATGCALGVRGVPVSAWPAHVVGKTLPLCEAYLASRGGGRAVASAVIRPLMAAFAAPWVAAAASTPADGAIMAHEQADSPSARDARYRSLGHGWDAISSVFISWDALQACDGDWARFINYAAAHGGDSDSTAAIGGAWFGALYGLRGVPNTQTATVEYHERMETMAKALHAEAVARSR